MSSFFQDPWMPRPRLPSPAGLGPSTPFPPPDPDSSTPNFRVSVGSPTEPKPQSTGLPSSNFDFALPARSLFPASRRSPSKPKTTNSGSPQALEDRPDPTDIHGLPVRLKRNRPPKSSRSTVPPTSDTNPSLTKPLGTSPFRAGFPGPAFESPASSHVPARDVLFSPAPSTGLPTRSGVSGARSSSLAPFSATSSSATILDNPKSNVAFSGIPPGDTLHSADTTSSAAAPSDITSPVTQPQKAIPGLVGSIRVLTAVENDETSKWSVHGSKRGTLAPKDLFKDCTLDEARGFITENPSILELLTSLTETPLLGGWYVFSFLELCGSTHALMIPGSLSVYCQLRRATLERFGLP